MYLRPFVSTGAGGAEPCEVAAEAEDGDVEDTEVDVFSGGTVVEDDSEEGWLIVFRHQDTHPPSP